TLEVILRVVFGTGDPELRDAIRRTVSIPMPRLIAMTLVRYERGPWGAYLRAVERLDELIGARIDATADDGSVLAVLKQECHEDGAPRTGGELRDQIG